MIQCSGNLVGKLSTRGNLAGKLNNAVVKEYPELEDLTVTPSAEEQNFKSSKYGYNNVTVKGIETEELNIIPTTTDQVKEGLFNKVTVAGDSDLVPENIKEGVDIFGVTGTAELKGEENAIIDSSKVTTRTGNNRDNAINKMIIKLPKNIDTSNWKSLAWLFGELSNLEELDLSNFKTNNVTTMYAMCYNCLNLKNINLKNLDTSQVTDMSTVFNRCENLLNLDLSSFNTNNVTTMEHMLSQCYKLKSVNMNSFNTSNVTKMNNMFQSCTQLSSLDLSNFDYGKIINISSFLLGCSSLTNLNFGTNLGKGYTQKSTNYSNYKLDLSYCKNLTYESLMDVINKLYDLNLTYNVAGGGTLYSQSLVLGSTNLAKLTSEEIAIATAKRLDCIVKEEKKMLYFSYTKPKMIVAENGKQIRQKDDIYKEAYIDENGQEVPEHLPYYSTTIFVPDSFTEEQMNELYIEENIEN